MFRRSRLIFTFLMIIFLASSFGTYIYFKKGMQYWFLSYLKWEIAERMNVESIKKPIHIMFLIVDHFEPTTLDNMQDWCDEYISLVKGHKDADGFPFRYTWFYFADGYRKDVLEKLAELCKLGLGEIELQLHHKNDTSATFREKLKKAKTLYRRVGALYTVDEKEAFAYVAGNWALDNSVIRNGRNFSGVNNELQILKEEGCYADFTFPSKNMAQPKFINKIYYAFDDPQKAKSYDVGIEMEKSKTKKYEHGALTIFEGPLFINWRDRKHIFYPSIEDGQIQASNPPTKSRINAWVKASIHVKGNPNWIFIKTFTHGASPKNKRILFGSTMKTALNFLETKYNDGKSYVLHYVTAREAYNIAKAAEYGLEGDPGQYRNFLIKPYKNSITVESSERKYLINDTR